MHRFISIICAIALISLVFAANAQEERRLIPVKYKACGPGGSVNPVDNLFDGMEDDKHKWCCFHAGYANEQSHWVIMDLGANYSISRIVVVHEGNDANLRHLLTEDFRFFGSKQSMDGPWNTICEINDNLKKKNEIRLSNPEYRYIGLEVTDAQVGIAPNQSQDDWAVRITELYIYTNAPMESQNNAQLVSTDSPFVNKQTFPAPNKAPSESSSSGASKPVAPKPPAPVKANPDNKNKTIYYFYNPYVDKCKKMEDIFTSSRVIKALEPFNKQAVNTSDKDPRFKKFGVFVVPTVIITDQEDNVLKKSSRVMPEDEFIEFLNKP